MKTQRLMPLLLAAAIQACGPGEPDAELRMLVDDAEHAAESRDTGFFRDLVGAAYRDARGNDRDQIVNLIRGYFVTHAAVEIVSRVDEIELAGADAARVVAHVGLLGRVAGESLVAGTDVELHRLELELVRTDGDWQVIGASWDRRPGE